MPKFATKKVEEINAKVLVEQLTIDGLGQLAGFEGSLSGTTYMGEYRTILKYIEYVANGQTLPKTKFRILKGGSKDIVEYEFKSKHLRIYAIKRPNKKLIIFLGYKNNQDADIASFRALTQQYLNQIKNKENDKG